MKKIYIISIILFAFILGGCSLKPTPSIINLPTDNIENVSVDSAFIFQEQSFDFGLIKQSSGKVTHDFAFIYNGQDPIKIIGAPTSCGCTSATVRPTNLNPGDSGILTVNFNPNLHAEPQGKFFKTISLVTDPELKNSPEIKIWVTIDLDLGAQAYELKTSRNEDVSPEVESTADYQSVSAEKFNDMLQNKDFTLIDVHVPHQDPIPGTDLAVYFNELEKNGSKLPQNKNAKIVVYCRSGSMSRAAAYVLKDMGYTNVYDLVGGKNAYDEFLKIKL